MNFKTNNIASPKLSIQKLARVQKVFEDKNWPIEDFFEDAVFENLCNQLAELNDEQCDLIIRLTEKFLWVRQADHLKYFSVSFDFFVKQFDFRGENKIYMCPILLEEDFGKSKSSVSLLYLVKAHISAIQRKYNTFSITYTDSPQYLDFDLIKQGYSLCLIDDFVGTGDTIISATEYLLNKGVPQDSMAIVSLVSMAQGVDLLKKKGYNIYTCTLCNKGISDDPCDTLHNRAIMETIETAIKVTDNYKFGYGSSEALVKMERTPNNTFPIFWLKNSKNKHAPFPR